MSTRAVYTFKDENFTVHVFDMLALTVAHELENLTAPLGAVATDGPEGKFTEEQNHGIATIAVALRGIGLVAKAKNVEAKFIDIMRGAADALERDLMKKESPIDIPGAQK